MINLKRIKIRKPRYEDLPMMSRIAVDGWYQNFIDEERGVDASVLKNTYGQEYDNPKKIDSLGKVILNDGNASLVAECDGKVIGWIDLENLYTPDISWLNIYIHKAWQRKGVGTLLMNSILNKYRNLEIHVATPEKANLTSFYEKFGFVEYTIPERVDVSGKLFMLQMKRDSS